MSFKGFITFLISLAFIATNVHASEAELNKANEILNKDTQSTQRSQQRINKLDEKTQDLLQDYRATNAEVDQLQLYNKQMREIVGNQKTELEKIDQQIKEIEFTERGILPLMNHMLSSLQQFIALDLPFLQKERQTRLVNLQTLLARADVTVSEKYRRILEAYQIEIDYGRTLEAYREQDADQLVFDYLRIGRTALYRIGINGEKAWSWNRNNGDWQAVESSMMRDLRKALDVARQTAAPELLTLPMPTPASLATATNNKEG